MTAGNTAGYAARHDKDFRAMLDNNGQVWSFETKAHSNMVSPKPTVPQLNHGVTLAEWGRLQGISYKTAWRMVREGKLPLGTEACRLPTGTIRIRESGGNITEPNNSNAVIYARINPRQERKDLERQIVLCQNFCSARGWVVVKTLEEIAPSLGAGRTKLQRLLDPPPNRIVIWKQSILSRFDFRLLTTCLGHCGCELVVVDQSDERRGEGGAMEDLVDAVSLICHRHYGAKRGMLMLEQFRKVIDSKAP